MGLALIQIGLACIQRIAHDAIRQRLHDTPPAHEAPTASACGGGGSMSLSSSDTPVDADVLAASFFMSAMYVFAPSEPLFTTARSVWHTLTSSSSILIRACTMSLTSSASYCEALDVQAWARSFARLRCPSSCLPETSSS